MANNESTGFKVLVGLRSNFGKLGFIFRIEMMDQLIMRIKGRVIDYGRNDQWQGTGVLWSGLMTLIPEYYYSFIYLIILPQFFGD